MSVRRTTAGNGSILRIKKHLKITGPTNVKAEGVHVRIAKQKLREKTNRLINALRKFYSTFMSTLSISRVMRKRSAKYGK